METLRPVATATATLPSGVPPPAAAAAARGYPGWVMLMPYATAEREVDDSEYSTSNSGGAKITGAASRSSSGHLVRVSLRLESPPAASGLSFHCSPCGGSGYGAHHYRPSMYVVAAHGDSVLLEMHYQKEGYQQYGIDYFFYNAGDGDEDPPRRPPSLSLSRLIRVPIPSRPGCVEVAPASSRDTLEGAELVVLRSGEWSATPIAPIVHDDGKGEELSYWETDMAVPVGDRLLCYVDLYRGVILCGDDLFDEIPPRLQYVSLPVEAPAGAFDEEHFDRQGDNYRRCLLNTRTVVCAIDGGGAALKFVDISSRCCCGSLGKHTTCDRSSRAFVIRTWTLRIDGDGDDDMAWTMDAMIDAAELGPSTPTPPSHGAFHYTP
ncbi:hypothetical protein OsJ_33155 [Oryza sativa Japonica Group]|uniref:DUF1618 domain-containing protein n=1 Tax=Oryza sativa subsp. japonica TaxID=39947 RepID=B9G9N4_ORYSJ|nr:hypothetical protein OsJ_33155 [Oryza sativa Japonica Group]